jgi:hypothetical protein
MREGAWHQCGDKSQKVVTEQLENGNGVGAIISPRDVARTKATEYASQYRSLGAHVLLDQQFYIPDFSNAQLSTYPISQHRAAISQLNQISDAALDQLAVDLEQSNRELEVSALLAPAVIYEAGRLDIVQLNARMFLAAKRAGDALGVPTYATVVLGKSVTSSEQTLSPLLDSATACAAAGWYFGFEFDADRIPTDRAAVERAGRALITLACTGKPVLHAFAGPMAVLSLGFGATGAGIGQSQNTWQFTPERWQPPSGQGGGGNAPSRFFSTGLWGTIIYPDETARLPSGVTAQVLTHSPFSGPVAQNPPQLWTRWAANKHLVYQIGQTVQQQAQITGARLRAASAKAVLQNAVSLHATIAGAGLQLADGTSSYQANWSAAIDGVLTSASYDYDYLELIS